MEEQRFSSLASFWNSVSQRSEKRTTKAETTEFTTLIPDSKGIAIQNPTFDKAYPQTWATPFKATDLEENGEKSLEGKPWKVGKWTRFPWLSFSCILVILGSLVGVTFVLLVSEGKSVDTWDSRDVKISGHYREWKVGVSTWISIFDFIMGKALTVMFAEAVTISWWVDALQGQTIRRLHFKWAVGQSIITIIKKRRFWGWICVASIAFTAFAGLEALLQTASSTTTALSPYQNNMTAILANALPAGFSGVIAATGHDSFGTVYYSPIFTEVLQNYNAQSPIQLHLDGCPITANSSCAITLPGVGFQYTCTASRSGTVFESTQGVGPKSTVFEIGFAQGPWSITLNASWKDTAGETGLVVANSFCTLQPALVEYPVNLTQQVATLELANSTVSWTSNSSDIGNDGLKVDKVLHVLPEMDYDKKQSDNSFPIVGSHSTLGGIGLALSTLFDSSINVQFDPTNEGARTFMQGSFVAPYAQFSDGTTNSGIMNNTFASPMDQLLSNIRDIMFRSSMAIAQHNISEYVLEDNSNRESQGTHVPSEAFTRLGQAFVYETVYKTNKLILSLGIGLMLLALLAILPLYWGFWRLGRNVSMSPLEIAKALHYSTITDLETESVHPYSVLDAKEHSNRLPQFGSNFSDDELVSLLGYKKVKYGEVAPHTLGMGLSEYTNVARKGRRYH